jgi:putative DNA primase/helicase
LVVKDRQGEFFDLWALGWRCWSSHMDRCQFWGLIYRQLGKCLAVAEVNQEHWQRVLASKAATLNQTALNRFSGSIAFIAAARAAFAVLEDPENDERRFLLQAKNNLGKKCKGLVFRMEQRLVSEGIVSSNIFFESEHVSQSIDEALTASEKRGGAGSQTSGKVDVAEFLKEILADGPVDVLEVERRARQAALLGETKRIRENKAFRDARKELGVQSKHEGFGPGSRYLLSLPGTPCAPNEPMCAPAPEGAHMEDLGAHEENGTFVNENGS